MPKTCFQHLAFALCISGLFSCGPKIVDQRLISENSTNPPATTEVPEQEPIGGVRVGPFDAYVKSFESLSNRTVVTPIFFVNALEIPEALAVCRSSADGTVRQIEVVRSTFGTLEGQDRQQAEYIIFHELGHCELGRPHTSQHLERDPFAPYSMMFPTFPRPFDVYLKYKSHYLGELFGSPQLKPDTDDQNALIDFQPDRFVGECFMKVPK